MSIVIVDGISAAGKSLLLQALQRTLIESRPNYAKFFLTEHFTERYFEKGDTSTESVHEHVLRILNILANVQAMHLEGPFSQKQKILTIVVERLFLTLMSRGMLTKEFFDGHGGFIQGLNIKNIFLYVPPDLIAKRIEKSLSHRNAQWHDFVLSLGGVEGAARHFLVQQEKMLALSDALQEFMTTHTVKVANVDVLSQPELLESLL